MTAVFVHDDTLAFIMEPGTHHPLAVWPRNGKSYE